MKRSKKMRNNKWLFYCLILFVLWLLVCYILYGICGHFDDKHTFVASSSLFAALAVGLTAYNLKKQQDDRLQATTLDVYIHIFDKMLKDEHLKGAIKYVRQDLYKDLVSLNPNHDPNCPKEMLKSIIALKNDDVKFEKVNMVHDNIEYLGVLVKHNYIAMDLVVDYWDDVIEDTFEKLKPFILEQRKTTPFFCFHYQYLYEHSFDNKASRTKKKKKDFSQFNLNKHCVNN